MRRRVLLLVGLVLASAAASAWATLANDVTLTGWISMQVVHHPTQADVIEYRLTDATGARTALLVSRSVLAAAGGARALDGQQVVVVGVAAPPVRTLPALTVRSITLVPTSTAPAAPLAAAGPVAKPWLTLACRFADLATVTPHTIPFFENLIQLDTYPSMNHYFRDMSYGAITLDGSATRGWFNLPKARSAYLGGGMDLDLLSDDCIAAAAAAGVDVAPFFGINQFFNGDLPVSVGGSWVIILNGSPRRIAMTWLPPWGYHQHGVVAHEMGHGFGLPHSSGPYSATYDSRWDVMSNSIGECRRPSLAYNCVGPGTIAYHKQITGWLPDTRRVLVQPGDPPVTVDLEWLGTPASADGMLVVKAAVFGEWSRFYTVEARDLQGYDAEIVSRGVIIHNVDTLRNDRDAQVVGLRRWLPGQQFRDATHNITVRVLSETATGFRVTVSNGVTIPPQQADLTVTALSNPPDAIAPATRFFVTTETLNQGDKDAGRSRVRFYFSLDNLKSVGDVLLPGTLGPPYVPALAVGASHLMTTQLTVPATTPQGLYFLIACADAMQVIAESNEGNNCMTAGTTLVGP